jgi:hypothetical protein
MSIAGVPSFIEVCQSNPPFSRTSSFYNSFIPFTIRLWNTFPLIITESPSLNIFKNSLTHFYKMSILLLFGINVCMESNRINLKLLNLGQISKKWLLSSNEYAEILNIFKNRLTHFYKTWDTNAHYNFGMRKFNIMS